MKRIQNWNKSIRSKADKWVRRACPGAPLIDSTNNFDVVSYNVKDITSKVEVLNAEKGETKRITKHLQEDIDHVRIVSNVAVAFGVIGAAGSIVNVGLTLFRTRFAFTKAGVDATIEDVSQGEEGLYHLGDGSNHFKSIISNI